VFNTSARAVMRTLARSRDLTVLSETARVAAKKAKRRQAVALGAIADTLDAERAQLQPLDMIGAQAGLKDLLALAQVWPDASPRQIKRGAQRVIRRARRARRRGQHAHDPARRHEWRKREKDRFYAALLLADAWPSRRRRKMSEELGDLLGLERDALLLIDRVKLDPQIAGGAKGARRALRALRTRCDRYADRADALGAELHAGGV
jgi:hypothetical protein